MYSTGCGLVSGGVVHDMYLKHKLVVSFQFSIVIIVGIRHFPPLSPLLRFSKNGFFRVAKVADNNSNVAENQKIVADNKYRVAEEK